MTPAGTSHAPAGEVLLAHHVALLAIPAIVPAVVVVGVVLYIARKDRQAEREERDLIDRAFDAEPDKRRQQLTSTTAFLAGQFAELTYAVGEQAAT